MVEICFVFYPDSSFGGSIGLSGSRSRFEGHTIKKAAPLGAAFKIPGIVDSVFVLPKY
jgi:hypothetical protein